MASAVPAVVPPALLPACQQPNAQPTAQVVGVPSHSLGPLVLEAFELIKLVVKISAAQGAASSGCNIPAAEEDAAPRQHHCLWTHCNGGTWPNVQVSELLTSPDLEISLEESLWNHSAAFKHALELNKHFM